MKSLLIFKTPLILLLISNIIIVIGSLFKMMHETRANEILITGGLLAVIAFLHAIIILAQQKRTQ